MGGTEKRMKSGVWWTGRLDTIGSGVGGWGRRGARWQVEIQADLRGPNQKEVWSSEVSQWKQRHWVEGEEEG